MSRREDHHYEDEAGEDRGEACALEEHLEEEVAVSASSARSRCSILPLAMTSGNEVWPSRAAVAASAASARAAAERAVPVWISHIVVGASGRDSGDAEATSGGWSGEGAAGRAATGGVTWESAGAGPAAAAGEGGGGAAPAGIRTVAPVSGAAASAAADRGTSS